MCGRYYFNATPTELVAHLGLINIPTVTPRYNVAPTQKVAVVAQHPTTGARKLGYIRWGLVPWWSAGPGGPPLVNAKAETVAHLPSFREAFRQRRCLIPASGFYEWQAVGKQKVPHLFRPRDGGVLAFAGLWEQWGEGDERVLSCALVTTAANPTVAPLHARMPAILSPAEYGEWMADDTPPARLLALLRPAEDDLLTVAKVRPLVNKVQNDGPELVEAA